MQAPALALAAALTLVGCAHRGGHGGAAGAGGEGVEDVDVPLEAGAVDVAADLAPVETPPDVASDPAEIQRVVKAHGGRVQACVERSLRVDPDVAGTVGVGFTVAGGAVTEAHLVRNTTGDKAMGACIVGAVRSFRFDPATSATVAEYPWAVSGR